MADQNQAPAFDPNAAYQSVSAPSSAPSAPKPSFDPNVGYQEATPVQSAAEKSNAAVTRMQQERPPVAENLGVNKDIVGSVIGGVGTGLKNLWGFATSVAKDVSDPNKPLFVSETGAAPGSEGESTLYKYGFAPQVEQFNKARESQRLAEEAQRKGDTEGYENYTAEAAGHYGASVTPLIGPWLAGHAEHFGQTGDLVNEATQFATEYFAGRAAETGIEKTLSGASHLAGRVAESGALKMGASPEVAANIGNIASVGAIDASIGEHLDALDTAVDKHIAAEQNFDAASKTAADAEARVNATPEDVNAKANLDAANKDLVKAGAARDAASRAVDKIQDNVIKQVTPMDWSKVSFSRVADMFSSAVGTTSDFNEAVTRFAGLLGKRAGQSFKESLAGVSDDLKAILNSDTEGKIKDPNTAADAIDQHLYQNIENPLQRESGATREETTPVVQNFRALAEARIDKFFEDNPGKAGSPEQEAGIKERLLNRIMREHDLGNGVTAPREPNLYEAESIRQGLKQYEPNETNGFRMAAYDLANFMREVIDRGYGERGVEGVKESRAKEAKLIDISEALRKSQTMFENQQREGPLARLWHSKPTVGIVATIGSILAHTGALAAVGAGILGFDSLRQYNVSDMAGNLARARKLAGREPEAEATTPEITQQQPPAPGTTPPSGGPGPTGGTGLAPIRPNVPPPPTPPEAAVRPPINHAVNGELAAYFPDATRGTTAEEYNALKQRFMDDYQQKLRGVAEFKAKNPGTPLPEEVAEEWEAAKELKGRIEREGAKEDAQMEKENQKRQDRFQKDTAKYQAKYQADAAKAQAEAVAKAEQEKAAAKQAEKDRTAAILADKRVAHAPFVNATEPSKLSPREGGHEVGGHVMVANAVGLNPIKFLSEFHPELEGTDSLAQVHTDASGAAEGPVGLAQRALTHLGGPAWDEVHHNIPMDANDGARSDVSEARRILREEGGLEGRQLNMMMDALYDKAKEIVSNPDGAAIAKANAALREEGLHDSLHMSENRIKVLNKLFKGVFGDDIETTLGGKGVREGATDGGVQGGEPTDTGAEGKEQDGAAGSVPAGSPRAAGEEAGGGTEKSKLSAEAMKGMMEASRETAAAPPTEERAKEETAAAPLTNRKAALRTESEGQANTPTAAQNAGGTEKSALSKDRAKRALDTIVKQYGTSENVEPLRREHSFILPDGKLVHLEGSQHGDVIAEHAGLRPSEENGWDNRPEFVNKSGVVRAHGYQNRAGDNLTFSVPKDGVTPEQADTMNRAASQGFMRNGTLNVERADVKAATKDQLSKQKSFPKSGDAYQMLRDIDAHPGVEKSALKGGINEVPTTELPREELDKAYDALREGKLGKATVSGLVSGDPEDVAIWRMTQAHPEGGFTVDPRTGTMPRDGYMVETSKTFQTFDHPPTDVEYRRFIDAHKDELAKDPSLHIGGWRNPEGEYTVALSSRIPDRDTAIALGKQHKQISIYDLGKGEEIPTGGTGEYGVEKSALTRPKGSSVPLMENPLEVKPGKGREEMNTLDLTKALNQFSREKNPALEPGSEPKEMVARAKKIAEDEAKYQLAQSKTGTEWYTTEMKDHDAEIAKLRPELLTGPKTTADTPWAHTANMTLFKAAEAILSSGQKPYANVKAAIRAWDLYKETGEFPPTNPATGKSWGPRQEASYGNAFDAVNRLIQEKGEKGAADWLLAEHPVSELKEYHPNVSGKKTDMEAGAKILGEKRGPFMQNLHGIESKFTADMWVSRTWNRWMGTLDLNPRIAEKGKVTSESDAPRNNTERALMKESFSKTADKLGLTTSSLQAVLWYYEQALYRAHGLPIESWSFKDAAKRVGEELAPKAEQESFPFGAKGEGFASMAEPSQAAKNMAAAFAMSKK